jgi:hypothetical protein
MLSRLKNYFLLLRSQHALRNNATSRVMLQYERAKNIGVLFNSKYEGKEAQAINHFLKRLREEGKNVKALSYFPQERSNPFDFKFDYFTNKDLTVLGQFKNEVVDRFVSTDFDYLYCLNDASFLPFDFILAQSKARFRIGIYQPEEPGLFELMINPVPGQELATVIDDMLSYTRRISESGEVAKQDKKQA